MSYAPAHDSLDVSWSRIFLGLLLLLGLGGWAAAAAAPASFILPCPVVDAEWDVHHDRLILVSADPHRIHRWTAGTTTLVSADLPAAPTCVSVSPDGGSAVVGHSGRVTCLDLSTMTQTASWIMSIDAHDIVHGGNGFAYVFPLTYLYDNVSCMDLTDGTETQVYGPCLFGPNNGRLKPGSMDVYAAGSVDILHLGIAGGTAVVQGRGPVSNAHVVGGDLWFNDQGTRLLTRSGNLFLASDDPSADMAFAGCLPVAAAPQGDTLIWADQGGPGYGRYAVILKDDDSRMALFHADLLDPAGIHPLPGFPAPGGLATAHGRWVFLSADGNTAHVIAQADAAAHLAQDHAIISFDLATAPAVTITSPEDGAAVGRSFTVSFRTTVSWPPPGGGMVRWSLDGVSQGQVTSPFQIRDLVPGDHAISVTLIDHLGAVVGAASTIAVHVSAGQPAFTRLTTDVKDAAYDVIHDRMILVSANPPRITRWSPASFSGTSLDLTHVPQCLGLSPDGTVAVVGFDGGITIVDLASMTQTQSWSCSSNAGSVVHGGDGHAYVFPAYDEWPQVHCINLADGAEHLSGRNLIDNGIHAKLRPGHHNLYGTSMSGISCYSLANGLAEIIRREEPGYYRTQGAFWFNRQGTRILSQSGQLLLITDDHVADMTHAGRLPGLEYLVGADHGGPGAGWYAAITHADDNRFSLINADLLDEASVHILPPFSTLKGAVASHGRWIFLSADGDTAHVIATSETDAGLVEDHAIISFDVRPQPGITITGPATGTVQGSTFPVSYRTASWPPAAGGSVHWSLDGVHQGIATNPFQVQGAAPGDHVISVALIDHLGVAVGPTSTVTIRIAAEQPSVLGLTTDVVDAEFDTAHGRMFLISAEPPRLHCWSAGSVSMTSVALPATPTCVSVSPDGASVVVGHDGRATCIDVNAMAVTGSWPTSVYVLDIVHGGNGFAYVFPRWEEPASIHCINLTTGTETLCGGNFLPGTLARLRPGSQVMYGARNGYSVSEIERYSIANGTAQIVRDSPYHGDFNMGGNLWFNDQGTMMLSRAGNLFQATDVAATDMTYAGHVLEPDSPMQMPQLVWADHAGTGAGRYAIIATADDTRLSMIDGQRLAIDDSRPLPAFSTLHGPVAARGRWVFLSIDGHVAHVVARADTAAGLGNDYAILSFDVTPQPSLTITSPATHAVLTGAFNVSYQTIAWPPPSGGLVRWSLDGVVQGTAVSPFPIQGLASGTHTIGLSLIDHLGTIVATATPVSIDVVPEQPGLLRLAGEVIDAEFDAAHARMFLVTGNPPQIHRWAVGASVTTSIALPFRPECLSISPDGGSVVVGHDGRVTRIDATTMTQTGSWFCSADPKDIVHGGNGFAYVYPRYGQWVKVRCINMSTGVETLSVHDLHSGSVARLRPGAQRIFGTLQDGFDSYDLHQSDITNGTANVGLSSPNTQSRAINGNIWFNDAGTTLLARSGNLFRFQQAAQVVYDGCLPTSGNLVWADHGGSGSGWFSVIEASTDSRIAVIRADRLDSAETVALPPWPGISPAPLSHGRWVFLSSDGTAMHVVANTDPVSGLINGDGIITIDMRPTVTSTPVTTATVGSAYAYDITCMGTPGPLLSATTLPGWLVLNGSRLTGTPPAAGDVPVEIIARNGLGIQTAQAFVIRVGQASQTISFAPIGDQTLGVAPITLSATASSGLPATFSVVSGPATIVGSTLTITGPGTVVVAADQAGNANYRAATRVTQSITVKVSQTIAFAPIGDQVLGVAPIALSATASSGLPVTFSVVSGPANIQGPMLTITGTGTVVVAADQAGNGTYHAAPRATQTITVRAAQTITFAPIGDQVLGVAPIALSATASSGLPVIFSVVSGPASIQGPMLTITGPGTVVVAADQAGNGTYHAAPRATRTITVRAIQTITFAPIGDQVLGVAPIPLSATSDSGLPVTFSVVGGPATILGSTLIITGAGTVVVAADQAGDATYLAAVQATQSLAVRAATGKTEDEAEASGGMCGMGSGIGTLGLLVAFMVMVMFRDHRKRRG